jgi:hypothetical protein
MVAVALSAGPTARLTWDVQPGLSGCPDEAWVRGAVAARLGRDPFDPSAALSVRARITRGEGAGLDASVEVTRADGSTGRRRLDSPTGDCLELASAVELAVTLAIEPRWLTTQRSAPPEPPPAVRDAPPPPAAPPAPPPSAPSPTVRGRVGLAGSAGGIPGVTAGLTLAGVIEWARASLALEARVSLPTGIAFGFGDASTFSPLASLVPCLRAGWFSGCAVLSVGPFLVDSRAGEVRRSTSAMVQAGARAMVDARLTRRLSLSPWAEVAAVLTQTSVVSGTTALWSTWPVALTGGVFLTVDFSS